MGDRIAVVYNVYTEPAHRRQGLARRIMDAIHAWCRDQGIASVALNASARRPAALRVDGLPGAAQPDDVPGVDAGLSTPAFCAYYCVCDRICRLERPRHAGDERHMPFIITDPCIETKDTACVDVCPGGLHPSAQGRSRVRGGDDAVYPSGGVHRLRRLRAGVSRGGDLRKHRCDAAAPERPDRSQRRSIATATPTRWRRPKRSSRRTSRRNPNSWRSRPPSVRPRTQLT